MIIMHSSNNSSHLCIEHLLGARHIAEPLGAFSLQTLGRLWIFEPSLAGWLWSLCSET